MKHIAYILSALLIGLSIGFFVGRKAVDKEVDIVYKKGDAVKVFIPVISPKAESLLGEMKFTDIIIPKDFHIPDSVDLKPTAYDWNIKREYMETLMDNEYGKYMVDAVIQYNKLQSITTNFVPLQKQITTYRKRVWQPFAIASYSTLGNFGVGGGIIYHDMAVNLKYVKDFQLNRTGLDVGIMYFF